jgi:hypothetical protein
MVASGGKIAQGADRVRNQPLVTTRYADSTSRFNPFQDVYMLVYLSIFT